MIGFLLLYCIKTLKHWKVLTMYFAEGLHYYIILFSDFIDKKPVTIVFFTLQVLVKLRNPCKLSFFFICFQARDIACHLESFNRL